MRSTVISGHSGRGAWLGRVGALVAVLALAMSLSGAGCGSGPVLGSLLDSLSTRANEVTVNAGTAMNGVVIQAGQSTSNAIEQTRQAYADQMNMTFNRVDQSTRNTYNSLKTMVDELETFGATEAAKVAEDSQTLINTLPFSSNDPQIKRYSPQFIAKTGPLSTGTDEMIVTVEGNFVDVQRPGFEPRLEYLGQRYAPMAAMTTRIAFAVPRGVLPQPMDNQVTLTSAKVIVPYRKAITHQRKDATFTLMIGLLPPTPGELSFTIYRKSTGYRVDHRRWPVDTEFSQRSLDSKTSFSMTYCAPQPTDGAVIPESPRLTVTRSGGIWNGHLIATTPPCALVFTAFREWWQSGRIGSVWFHLDYDVKLTATEADQVEQPIVMQSGRWLWGTRKTFDANGRRWKIGFLGFDGSPYETQAADKGNRFLRVETDASGNPAVTLNYPDKVQFFDTAAT